MKAEQIRELLVNFDPKKIEEIANMVSKTEYNETCSEILSNFRGDAEIPGAHMLLQELSFRLQRLGLIK